MRKDWSRQILPLNLNSLDLRTTEQLFGSSFLDSIFGVTILEEEVNFINENFEFVSDIDDVDNPEEYIQDNEYKRMKATTNHTHIKDEIYYREFNAWRERGFKLWVIYPSAKLESPIVKAWHSEITLLRQEFEERNIDLPF